MQTEPNQYDVPPVEEVPHGIVLFDGVCNFCHTSVNFIIDRDPNGYFRFASLQSEVGRRLLADHGLDDLPISTVVLFEARQVHVRSEAALRIAKRLRAPWPLAYALSLVPVALRDRLYVAFARRRYRWFGRSAQCRIPSPELRSRFLDAP